MQKLVWKNSIGDEIDLTSGNYGITEWEGFSNTSLNIQNQQVPFQDGGVFLDALMEQRELSVTLAINDKGNLETRYRLRRELIHALNPKLGEGYLIYTNDFISKRIKCVAQIPLFETHNSNDSGTPKASLAWTACEPYWEDLEETEIEMQNGTVVNIENNGDVETSVVFETANGINNFSLINQTTKKQINIVDSVSYPVKIDTGIGNKSAVSENEKFKYFLGGKFRSCAYGNGITVIVGVDCLCIDRLGNKIKILEGEAEIYTVAYGNNRFVACGSEYDSYVSYDGINWTKYADSTSWSFEKLKFYKGLFIGIHEGSPDVKISTDGISWTYKVVKEGGYNVNVNDVLYVNEKWYFLTSGSVLQCTNENFANCATFFFAPSGFQIPLRSFAYGNGTFVMCGYETNYNHILATSDNGTTFTDTVNADLHAIISCVFFEGKFFCTGIYGSSLKSNNNGVTWESVTLTTDLINLWCYVIGSKVCVLSEDGMFLISQDLEEWETVFSTSISQVMDMIKKENIFIAIGNTIIKCTDISHNFWTIKWVSQNNNIFLYSIAYGNGIFVAVGQGGLILRSNDNGENWSEVTSGVSVKLNKVIYSEEKELFCVVGNSGTILTSSDGINWSQRTSGISVTIDSIAYGNGLFIASAGSHSIKSIDLINWESVGQSLNYIVFGNNVFLAKGNSVILKSKNGIDWQYFPTVNGILKFANNLFYYIDSSYFSHKVYSSYNGESWEEVENNVTTIQGLYGKDGITFLFGNNGEIEIAEKTENNIIDKLSSNSDMTLSLQAGQNKIQFIDGSENSAVLKYRQKYIGV